MDFSDPVTKQYLIAFVAIAVGLSGWLMPNRYNVLKLKARYAKYVSESTNIKIARALGTVFIIFGVAIAIGTTMIGEIK